MRSVLLPALFALTLTSSCFAEDSGTESETTLKAAVGSSEAPIVVAQAKTTDTAVKTEEMLAAEDAEPKMDSTHDAMASTDKPHMSDMSAESENKMPDEELQQVFDAVNARLPEFRIGSVGRTPFPGVFEVVFGGQIIYVNADASAVIEGSMIDLQTGTDLTDARLGLLHADMINDIDEKDMLVYDSGKPSQRSLTVFTDISCGYCRRLHSELDTLLEGGVKVRYLLFPRAGLESQAHRDLESVWCAADPQEAMTIAKAGGPINPVSCSNPIESHVALAEQIGLRGTPLIYLDNGLRVPGYRPAPALVELINSAEPLSN